VSADSGERELRPRLSGIAWGGRLSVRASGLFDRRGRLRESESWLSGGSEGNKARGRTRDEDELVKLTIAGWARGRGTGARCGPAMRTSGPLGRCEVSGQALAEACGVVDACAFAAAEL
jgi:hypothetical protein